MFDLLREAYLIPKRFHGKAGKNPVLLTNPEGELLPEAQKIVSGREYSKFKETYKNHICAPRSKLYLADGYDIVRSYVNDTDMEITEKRENKRRGIMILYALPDTKKIGLTEAQAYAVVWDTFHNIQKEAPHAIVYYGQETGLKKEQTFDEIGLSMNTAITIFLKACAREKRIPFELTADPFYSSANQRYLEGIMRDVRSGKAHFAPHDLIEDA